MPSRPPEPATVANGGYTRVGRSHPGAELPHRLLRARDQFALADISHGADRFRLTRSFKAAYGRARHAWLIYLQSKRTGTHLAQIRQAFTDAEATA